MSDGQILVNFETVRGAGTQVRNTANQIKAQLDELKNGVNKIAQSWEGAAQEGYRAHQAQWDQRAAHLQETLAKIATALDAAAESYNTTENNNKKLWT
ncbi:MULTISPECIES: WXG100 family type VII secretion target [unclassified Kitasatospora]|uniref:WXG100 family type VII secretion target n=1 Tax=unclassified Kitasatospora TaxID=2633591 RepID=UPI001AE08A5C|nr:WXG100 family type VII secretion target [Kitasatospora sp. RG8]MBP0454952.1 WXG100 family type VII secretion target [Kitasatospora sp. RG8]